MIRGLHIDAFSGIAGDMFLGALLDCGLSFEALGRELEKIALGSGAYRLTLEEVRRGALRAKKFDVIVKTEDGREVREARPDSGKADGGHAHGHAHGHHQDHPHRHHHDHGHHHHHHDHPRAHRHEEPPKEPSEVKSGVYGGHHPHAHGRTYVEIVELIRKSGISERARELAADIFRTLGEAEAKVHGIPLEAVHFHEVGAIDSIVDICGAAIGLDLLGIEEVTCSAISIGSGTASMAHGTLPLPAPAAAEILAGLPVRRIGVTDELVTPTGAAILKRIVGSYEPRGVVRPLALGYGAGSTKRADPPNVVRVTLYERDVATASEPETVIVLETQVDDMTPEALGYLRERLEAVPVLDVLIENVAMKKNRPGHKIEILVLPEHALAAEDTLLRESSTFGLRRRSVERVILDREIVEVATPLGPARLKLGKRHGVVLKAAPEYEDCARLAHAHGIALEAVFRIVVEAYRAPGRATETPG